MDVTQSSHPLLYPRIKVIADFWDNPFKVGQIILFDRYVDCRNFYTDKITHKDWVSEFMEIEKGTPRCSKGSTVSFYLKSFTEYPNLFKLLKWHEDITESEIETVKYVKWIKPEWAGDHFEFEREGTIEEVRVFERFGNGWSFKVGSQGNQINQDYFLPATEKQYLKYEKSKGITPSEEVNK